MRIGLAACASACALNGAMVLAAGEARADPTPGEAAGNVVGEVVVTAQHRTERAMDVPISIAVVSQARVKEGGSLALRNLGELATGLTTTTNGLAFQPAIRGVTTTGTSAGDESNVALYVDGVYMAGQAGNIFNLRNIERIEVEKGPQGTLFGRNATGGAIQIITSQPSFTPRFDMTASYGFNLQSKEVNAYVSGPLTDTLAASLTGDWYDDNGYVTSLNPGWDAAHGKLSRQNNWNLRGKLLWKPNDHLSFTLAADDGLFKTDTQFVLAPIDRINSSKNNPAVRLPTGPWQYSGNVIPNEWVRTWGLSLTGVADEGPFTLTSITAYRSSSMFGVLDVDRVNVQTSFANTSNDFRWFTQEVDVASHFTGPVNFIGGVYYYHSPSSVPLNEAWSTSAANPATCDPTGFCPYWQWGRPSSWTAGFVTSDSGSVFGEATIKPTDKLSLIGGLRYTYEHKRLFTAPILAGGLPAVSGPLFDSHAWRNLSYRATLKYDFTSRTNAYFTASTGFKSGEYVSTSPILDRVDPETIQAYELGLKSRILSNLSFTVSGFYYKYDNIQLSANNFINGTNQTILKNAANATMYGVDADFDARLFEHFTLSFGVAYLPHAQYDKFNNALDSVPIGDAGSATESKSYTINGVTYSNINPADPNGTGVPTINTTLPGIGAGATALNLYYYRPGVCSSTTAAVAAFCHRGDSQVFRDIPGTRMIRAPKVTINTGVTYDTPLAGGEFIASANVFYTSGFYWVVGQHIAQPSYTTLNGRVAWRTPDKHFTFSVWGRNLTDAGYAVYTSPNAAGVATAWAAPREVGISLDVDY